jgi:signal peptidase I
MPAAPATKPALSKSPPPNSKKTATAEQPPGRATRETIESVIIAIVLAFLFRAFEAEAFVIPTGSMAPTLMGRHRDVTCPQCGYQYRSGTSDEENRPWETVATICPICRYTKVLNKEVNPNEASFSGDRILVSKFAYHIGEPERWDPIVFKFPGNPKINYIKRLIGLPGEKGRIYHGDIYVIAPGDSQERIARKPPHKLLAMLQVVDDSRYVSPALVQAKWPSRWFHPKAEGQGAKWRSDDPHKYFTDGAGGLSWLRYQHQVPNNEDWEYVMRGDLPPDMRGSPPKRNPSLITDFYTYNNNYEMHVADYAQLIAEAPDRYEEFVRDRIIKNDHSEKLGDHWVGDLALECNVEIANSTGELLLDLVEGGSHYTCAIDIAAGTAKLSIDDGARSFSDDEGKQTQHPQAATAVRGPGKYQLRLSNCDDEVLLWVNNSVVRFDVPTTYVSPANCQPRVSASDPLGDLSPAGIGTKGASFFVERMRILRDIYYIASNAFEDYTAALPAPPEKLFRSPELWDTTGAFESRGSWPFELDKDQFFPLGDNSPASQDARSWGAHIHEAYFGDEEIMAYSYTPKYVNRDLLIGKALLIYWPHAWNRPVPFTPNVQRMGVIK